MTRFPTAGHLASWAGMCPGNNITGGKRKSGTTNNGNRWLGEILNQAAVVASHTRDTYPGAQYWRPARRIGKHKAAVAVGHSILVICWHLLANDCDYDDLGGRLIHQTDRQRQAARPPHPPTPRTRLRRRPYQPRGLNKRILLTGRVPRPRFVG